MIVLLDSGPLGRVSNPKPKGESKECVDWLEKMIALHVRVLVPEICDYEIRRELLRARKVEGIKRLDELRTAIGFLPLSSSIMLKAAELWADIRNAALSTADDKALDGDVILAAQALEVQAIVATENVSHLSRFVDSRHWRRISAP
jgi:predicted nucleic acid-binding protein